MEGLQRNEFLGAIAGTWYWRCRGAVLAGVARRGDMGGLPGLVEASRLPTSKVLHTFTLRRI